MKKMFKNTSFFILILWVLCAVFADFIANEKAIFSYNGENCLFFTSKKSGEFSILPPIPYSPNTIDFSNANYKGPFDKQNYSSVYYRHWLGTDNLGRDVLSNLIHGSRTSFLIGVGSLLLASLIGIIIGGISAFYGDNTIKINRGHFLRTGILFIIGICFIFFFIPWNVSSISFLHKSFYVFLILASVTLLYFFSKKQFETSRVKKVNFPLDLYFSRFVETFDAIPLLFILIALSSFVNPSFFSSILIIGMVSWPTLAQYTRAEFLKQRTAAYVENSIALGLKDTRLILFHILPNAMPAVAIRIVFLLSATILIESTLAFMGLGINSDTASWGELLNSARSNYEAWWLTLFPGLTIFLLISACSSVAEQLSRKSIRQ